MQSKEQTQPVLQAGIPVSAGVRGFLIWHVSFFWVHLKNQSRFLIRLVRLLGIVVITGA